LLGLPNYLIAFTDPETRKRKTWASKDIDLNVKAPCKQCNETWMSDIETEASTVLADMIRDGKRVTLSPRDIVVLATFAFKTAIMSCFVNPAREPFFSIACRERFRASLAIPAEVQMWIGALSALHTKGTFIGYVNGQQTPIDGSPWKDLEFQVFTFAAGHLVFQVLTPRWADIRKRGMPLPVFRLPDKRWDNIAVQFWPSNGLTLKWPLSQYLSDISIDEFTYRWNQPVFRMSI